MSRRQAFVLGFITKIAEERLDPKYLNDTLEMVDLVKTASPVMFGAAAAGVSIPLILRTLLDAGVNIPMAAGELGGKYIAEEEAGFDDSMDEVAKKKLLRDYEKQIAKLRAKNNNKAVSKALKP